MNNSDYAIEVKDVKKTFKVFYDKGNTFKERFISKDRSKYERRDVLKGISFNVNKGEAIGLIGRNGCGKSTTLKMLSRIMYPDSGTIKIQGRVSSLIELGAGFHPDMSGRENIYTNASIFGLTKKEIDKRLDAIIAFSELGSFIDNPVRTYSSGMYMRLAFSVAINVDADVLLIDEILSVGDASFQKKCFDKLMEIKNKGTTIIIVSHALDQIESFCDRSIWIEEGLIKEAGLPQIVDEHYMASMEQDRIDKDNAQDKKVEEPKEVLPSFCSENARRYGNKIMEFIDVTFRNKDGQETYSFNRNEDISIYYSINCKGINDKINIGYRILREDGVVCFASDYATNRHSKEENNLFIDANKDINGEIKIFTNNLLNESNYSFDIILTDSNGEVLDEICRVKEFNIKGNSTGIGVVELKTKWSFN